MALPAQQGAPQQGGLNQVRPTPPQSGGKFDASAKQAENLEEISQAEPTGLKDKIVDDLGDQREAMNQGLLRLRATLDARKNRMFDPVLMQVAAGLLKPTKTGSFGESLGNAAENASVAAEREMIRDLENQKLEQELLGKEMELRQQLGADQLMSEVFKQSRGSPAPAGGAVPMSQSNVAGAAPSVDLRTQSGQQKAVSDVRQGRIQVTDELLMLASRVAPKLLPFFQEMRRSQTEEDKIRIERDKYEATLRPVKPLGLPTERQLDRREYAEYEAKLQEAEDKNDEQILLRYYRKKGWLETEQLARMKPSNVKPTDGGASPASATSPASTTPTTDAIPAVSGASNVGGTSAVSGASTSLGETSSSGIPRAKTPSQLEEEKARRELEIAIEKKRRESEIDIDKDTRTELQKSRVKASEEVASKFRLQADAAFANTTTADDMIGYAKNNPKILQALNKPGVFGAIVRASEQGIKFGDFSVSLPAKTLAEANLDANDLAALQIFAQKSAELQSRGRQLNRTPGEGAISDFETRLLGSIYALPSDSQRAVILKSEALKLQSMFDEDRFALWTQKSKQPGYTYDDFVGDTEYKKLKTDYKKTLDRVREENLDLLTPKKKADASKPPSSANPPVVPSAKSTPPANESVHERFIRERAEREVQRKP